MEVLIPKPPRRDAPFKARRAAFGARAKVRLAALVVALVAVSATVWGCAALRAPVAPPPTETVTLSVERVTEQGLFLRIVPAQTPAPGALRLERVCGESPATPLYELTLNATQRDAWERGALELRDPRGIGCPDLRYTLAVAPGSEGPWELATGLETSSRELPPPPANLQAEATPAGVRLRWEPSGGWGVRLMRRNLASNAPESPASWEPLAAIEPPTGGTYLDRNARPGEAYAYIAQHVDAARPAPHLGAFGSPVYVALPPAP
ncbi:hypothetical protein FRC98_04670 [Lujinxingia vulgaris]|uniref:Fibronectin type-III domain-containing protein n=1 Tax=Lujinxingia vulgaris TaxID=2600176 RepID=A0A5C6XA08_9DELT|nr:hypothetical protein [Lujinxingia vulgaris]TXD38196.1 hypothetical protein FRC98_04670 [Lujinxingia vulgaris]